MTFRAFTPARLLPRGGVRPRRQFMPLEAYLGMLGQLEGLLEVVDAPPLDWAVAELAHDRAHLDRWRAGDVTRQEQLELGFAWTPQLPLRAELAAGGTVAALHEAALRGWGVNLAGGAHHARRSRAGGFSFVNDVAVAALHALHAGLARRVLVLDLDVHQGDGTAQILAGEGRAFTLSVHARNNYPFRKERSDLDVELEDGADDAAYLEVLERTVLPAARAFSPDLVLHVAGADVLAGDGFGRLALSVEGLRERDARVLGWCARSGVRAVTVFGGGYNRDPDVTARARVATVQAGLAAWT